MKKLLLLLSSVLPVAASFGQVIDTAKNAINKIPADQSGVAKTTHDIFVGIISGVLASFIFALMIGIVSKRARWILTGILGRVTNSDIEYVYANKKDSERDLQHELRRASRVYIITSRGNELKREAFESLLKYKPKTRKIDIKILLPRIICEAGEVDWVDIRDKEIANFDKAYGNGRLKKEIEINIDYLAGYSSDGVEVRYYSYPHLGRLIITDNCAFYSPYTKNTHGSSDPVFKFKRGASYNNYYRMFDLIWQNEKL